MWTREGHISRLCNCNTIDGKIYNELFLMRQDFIQCAMHYMIQTHERKRAVLLLHIKIVEHIRYEVVNFLSQTYLLIYN